MIKALAKLFRKGGLATFSIKYYAPEVEAAWTFDDEQMADPSLQIVYKRKYTINGNSVEEDYWLYLGPKDAAVVGAILTAWAQTHGETP